MKNLFLSLFLVGLAACHSERYTGDPIETTASGGDSNGDGVADTSQTIGVGKDKFGQPYVVFFRWGGLPAYRNNLQWIGFGCSAIDGDPSDDWLSPCAPLAPYMIDGELVGYALTNIPEDVLFEGVPVDADSFTPDGAGWANIEHTQLEGDDDTFFVHHVNWSTCPLEQQATAHHYGFHRVGSVIKGLGASIAPPNEDCSY